MQSAEWKMFSLGDNLGMISGLKFPPTRHTCTSRGTNVIIAFSGPILSAFHEMVRNDFLPDDVGFVIRTDEELLRICSDRHIAQIHFSLLVN